MSLLSILKAEFMKYKKSFLYKLIFIIPLLAFILLWADCRIRFDWLTSGDRLETLSKMGVDGKLGALLYESHFGTLWFILLSLAIVFISVMLNYLEYSENTWKQILSRPVYRGKIYFSKWIVTLFFTIILIITNAIGLIIIKTLFKVEGDFTLILKYVVFEILTALGVVSIQQFISCYIKNSLLSASIGFGCSIGSFMVAQSKFFGNIFPYSGILRALPLADGKDAITASIFGIISCIFWLFTGMWEFKNRDII